MAKDALACMTRDAEDAKGEGPATIKDRQMLSMSDPEPDYGVREKTRASFKSNQLPSTSDSEPDYELSFLPPVVVSILHVYRRQSCGRYIFHTFNSRTGRKSHQNCVSASCEKLAYISTGSSSSSSTRIVAWVHRVKYGLENTLRHVSLPAVVSTA